MQTKDVKKAISILGDTKERGWFNGHPPDYKEALSIAIEIMEDYLCGSCGLIPDECLCVREEY